MTFFVLGVLQQMGLLTDANAPLVSDLDNKTEDSTSYICPMMCTPPSLKPGRCPVCAMELVAAASGNNQADGRSIVIDSVARRVAGIETVTVEKIMAHHAIESIGELEYDQGGRKTLAAYVDGRIEQLYADYTGVKVSEKDTLAVLYSPKLYSAQVELLLALRARENSQGGTLARVAEINEILEQVVGGWRNGGIFLNQEVIPVPVPEDGLMLEEEPKLEELPPPAPVDEKNLQKDGVSEFK